MRKKSKEQMFQQQIVSIFENSGLTDMICCGIPNELLHKRTKKAKMAGVIWGHSDLYFIYDGKIMYIELKVAKNSQSASQKDFERRAIAAGAQYFVCYTLKDVFNRLEEFTGRDLINDVF